MPGLFDHVDLILEAKKRNYEVTTCDNNPNNIAHKYSNYYTNINLLDLDNLIHYVYQGNFDIIAAFSSDIGAVAVDYINTKICRNFNAPNAIKTMANKKKFRLFLKEHEFNVPEFQIINSQNNHNALNIKIPAIIKPVDRAGSKGICKINCNKDIQEKISNALNVSFTKEVIIEEFIITKYNHIHGDALVQDGELVFYCLGEQYFGKNSLEFYPIATLFPSATPDYILEKIKILLESFIKKIGYKNGAINIEVRVDENDKIYFIELAPRHGGNYIAKTISYFMNVNLAALYFDILIGKKINVIPSPNNNSTVFQFSLRCEVEGIYNSTHLNLNDNRFLILESHQLKHKGDIITINNGPDNIVAVYIIETLNKESALELINNTSKYFEIQLL